MGRNTGYHKMENINGEFEDQKKRSFYQFVVVMTTCFNLVSQLIFMLGMAQKWNLQTLKKATIFQREKRTVTVVRRRMGFVFRFEVFKIAYWKTRIFCLWLIFTHFVTSAKLQKSVFTEGFFHILINRADPNLRKLLFTNQEKLRFTKFSRMWNLKFYSGLACFVNLYLLYFLSVQARATLFLTLFSWLRKFKLCHGRNRLLLPKWSNSGPDQLVHPKNTWSGQGLHYR